MKRTLSLLRNNKSEDLDTIKDEFSKYWGEAIAVLLKDYFQNILQSEDIPAQWNLIDLDQGHQDKEKLDNKKGISLTSNIAKLFEKIVINRLNNHLQFTGVQAGAQPGNNTLTKLLPLKSVYNRG